MRRSRASQLGVGFNSTLLLRVQLQEEIINLERQLHNLPPEDATNFAKLRSYKDMIKSRRGLLNRLPH